MNNTEQHLLSILQAGDMIRFVLTSEARGKLAFAIEGAPSSDDNGMMFQRLELTLMALREAGFQFDGNAFPSPKLRSHAVGAGRAPLAKNMVEIRPRALMLGGLSQGVLGFSAECATPVQELALPAFHSLSRGPLFRSLADVLLQDTGISRFEIEFTHVDLPGAAIKPLERAMALHAANPMGPDGQNSPQRAFLSFWLLHRAGWRVRVRAWTGKSTPNAALEMVGRDIFSCDCEVAAENDDRTHCDGIDLSNCYPREWIFPAIFPQPRVFSKLSASRLHNRELPDLPRTGFPMGTADGEKVRLPRESRDRHTYIVGATGTGKSTLLLRMISEDIQRGEGVILLDPHGDLASAVLEAVPAKRQRDVFLIDPSDPKRPPGLNILDIPDSPFKHRQTTFVVGELFRFFGEMWNMRESGGPTFEMYFRNSLLLMCLQAQPAEPPSEPVPEMNEEILRQLLESDAPPSKDEAPPETIKFPLNLGDFGRVLSEKKFRDALLATCTDQSVVQFWKQVATKVGGDSSLANIVPYITSKISGLVQGGFVTNLVCAERNDFRLSERMNNGEIVIVNLNKGLLGSHESRMLGTILMMEIFAGGLQRSSLPKKSRRPVNVYVDEFQNFVSDNVSEMLSEARKFGLRLTLANQTLAQLKANPGRHDLLETVLGNVGNMILFRLGVPDADRLKLFTEPFTRQEIQELPNFHALVRLLTSEGPIRPVVMKTMLD